MNNEPCKSCGWQHAPNMHAVARIGFFFYCNRCHDTITKEAKKKHKERMKALEEQQENK